MSNFSVKVDFGVFRRIGLYQLICADGKTLPAIRLSASERFQNAMLACHTVTSSNKDKRSNQCRMIMNNSVICLSLLTKNWSDIIIPQLCSVCVPSRTRHISSRRPAIESE